MSKHTLISWISLVISSLDYIIALMLNFITVDEDYFMIPAVVCIALIPIGLVTGIIARFGKAKDNFGVPGIATIIVIPLLLVYAGVSTYG